MTPPDPHAAARFRVRATLVATALLIFGSLAGFYLAVRPTVQAHEQRVLAGDFAHVRIERGLITVEESGDVKGGTPSSPAAKRTVALYGLIPPGRYAAMLVANDGDKKHIEKTELVIGAQTAAGRWFPPQAEAVAARVLENRDPAGPRP